MAAPFTFRFGSLDLADFLRINPDEGWDPFDPDMVEPQLSQSPLREGAAHIQDVIGAREMVWPLGLNAPNKASLHGLEQQVTRELQVPNLVLEWKDQGASDSTFFDVIRARVEPQPNYRRSARNWQYANLRVWTQPFGHTGTYRLVATAGGTGALIVATLPVLAGDMPALLDAKVKVGSQVQTATQIPGRIVAVAVPPHPSYQFDLTPTVGASGASGAHGSRYIGANAGFLQLVPAGNATIYQGANRVLHLHRCVESHKAVSAADQDGNALGPTVTASAFDGWQLLDLGVWRVPEGVVVPAPRIQIGVGLADGPFEGRQQKIGPGNDQTALYGGAFLIPEETTAFVVDVDRESVGFDTFVPAGAATLNSLLGRVSVSGARWRSSGASQVGLGTMPLQVRGGQQAGAAALVADGGPQDMRRFSHVLDVSTRDLYVDAAAEFTRPGPSMVFGVLAEEASSAVGQTLVGQLAMTNGSQAVLSLLQVSDFPTSVAASLPVPSWNASVPFSLHLRRESDLWTLNLRSIASGATANITVNPGGGATTVPVASIGGFPLGLLDVRPGMLGAASFAPVSAGRPLQVYSFKAWSQPRRLLAPRDIYRFGQAELARHNSFDSRVAGVDIFGRSRTPDVDPGARSVAVLAVPFDQGAMNDLLSVEIRVLERFRFSR